MIGTPVALAEQIEPPTSSPAPYISRSRRAERSSIPKAETTVYVWVDPEFSPDGGIDRVDP